MRFIKSADLEQLQFAAVNYKKNQDYALAETSYRKLISMEAGLFGPETSSVALLIYNLAEVVVHQKKYDEARDLLKRAVQIWEKAHPSDYMSLLSYTEAATMVKRQAASQPSAVVATAAATYTSTSEAASENCATASVIPMRRANQVAIHAA